MIAAVALASIASSTSQAANATQPTLPPQIRDALIRGGNDISPLTVSWSYDQDTGSYTLASAGHEEHELTIQGGMLYSRLKRSDASAKILEHTFDGTNYFVGRPPQAGSLQPSLSILDIGWQFAQEPTKQWFVAPYFEMAGFSIPATSAELRAHATVESRILKLLADGANLTSCGSSTVDGKSLVRIELERGAAGSVSETNFAPPAARRFVFFLDPRFQHAVDQYHEEKSDGTPLLIAQNGGFKPVPSRALWLPEYCRITRYGGDHAQPIMYTLHATSIDPQLKPSSLFSLKYTTPGTKMHVQGSDGVRQEYEIPAQPADLAKAIAEARDLGFLRPAPSGSENWWVLVLSGAAATIAGTIGVLRFHRMSHKARGGAG